MAERRPGCGLDFADRLNPPPRPNIQEKPQIWCSSVSIDVTAVAAMPKDGCAKGVQTVILAVQTQSPICPTALPSDSSEVQTTKASEERGEQPTGATAANSEQSGWPNGYRAAANWSIQQSGACLAWSSSVSLPRKWFYCCCRPITLSVRCQIIGYWTVSLVHLLQLPMKSGYSRILPKTVVHPPILGDSQSNALGKQLGAQ